MSLIIILLFDSRPGSSVWKNGLWQTQIMHLGMSVLPWTIPFNLFFYFNFGFTWQICSVGLSQTILAISKQRTRQICSRNRCKKYTQAEKNRCRQFREMSLMCDSALWAPAYSALWDLAPEVDFPRQWKPGFGSSYRLTHHSTSGWNLKISQEVLALTLGTGR